MNNRSKSFSLIFPSRGKPSDYSQSVLSALNSATNPAKVEVVVRLDQDDPQLVAYFQGIQALGRDDIAIVGAPRWRYGSLPEFYEEAAAVASGDWLVFWNDDMKFVSPAWDAAILTAGGQHPLSVVTGRLTKRGQGGDQCRFACCAVPRRIYQVCGRICLGDDNLDSVDRVWEEFCRIAECERRADFHVEHAQDTSTPERDAYYSAVCNNWEARRQRWIRFAQTYADKCRKELA